jgi:hypothetical protein
MVIAQFEVEVKYKHRIRHMMKTDEGQERPDGQERREDEQLRGEASATKRAGGGVRRQ